MMKNKSSRKNKISQLFAMRTAIAKSRYKNPVGFFRGAQAINLSAHSFPGQDSGFPVPSDSQESSERTRTKRTWSDCPSVRRTCRNTSIKEFQWSTPRRVLPTPVSRHQPWNHHYVKLLGPFVPGFPYLFSHDV